MLNRFPSPLKPNPKEHPLKAIATRSQLQPTHLKNPKLTKRQNGGPKNNPKILNTPLQILRPNPRLQRDQLTHETLDQTKVDNNNPHTLTLLHLLNHHFSMAEEVTIMHAEDTSHESKPINQSRRHLHLAHKTKGTNPPSPPSPASPRTLETLGGHEDHATGHDRPTKITVPI